VDAKLQRRVQRYGWDLAAADYEPLWQSQLAPAQASLMACAALAPGERVLDVACGTGLVSFAAARNVGPAGSVVGVDISGQMVEAAALRAHEGGVTNARFSRMDAESLALPDAGFDVVLCALGLMYLPDAERALCEMRRVLRPGGRLVLAVWGERKRCGWSAVFEIVDAEVSSDVCPLFFRLGQPDALARACADAGFVAIEQHRFATTLHYANGDEACRAAFVGGPVALAWSRFDEATRARVCARYLEAIDAWRDDGADGSGYSVPGQFVVISAIASTDLSQDPDSG
jgi:ubiquinone/menaquinone biosynthesis C-methylase UbiE